MTKPQWFAGVCVGFAFWFCAAPPGGSAATAAEAAGEFRLSDAAYSKISAKRVETLRLTREGKFDAVEALLTPMQQAYERGEVNEFAAAIAFSPFSTGDDSLAAPLDRWVAQAPKSYSARLARARYLRARFQRYRSVVGTISPADIGEERVAEFAKRAIADYQAVLEMNPRLMIAYGDLVEMGLQTGNSALFRDTYRKALEVSPATWTVRDTLLRDGAIPREKLGGFLADAAKHEKANPLLLHLPSEVETDRADEIWRRGNYAQALAIYDEQAKMYDTFFIHKNRARLLRVMERFPEARVAIDHALALLPGKYDGYRERGWLHIDTKKWDEAAADFRRGLEIDPLDPELNRGLGMALEEGPDVSGSLRAYERSVRWAPYADLYQKIGWLYLHKASKPTESIAALDHAVALNPKDKWNWYKRAEAFDAMNDPRAREDYKHYLQLADPRSADDQEFIVWAKRRMREGVSVAKPPANAAR